MDQSGIEKLIKIIGVNYPQSRKYFESSDGKSLNDSVVEEWMRQISYLDYDEAVERLDAYMAEPDNKKPPMPADLKRMHRTKNEYFYKQLDYNIIQERPVYDEHGKQTGVEKFIKWKVINGRLYDEEFREYVFDPKCELPFYYDEGGNICQGTMRRCTK